MTSPCSTNSKVLPRSLHFKGGPSTTQTSTVQKFERLAIAVDVQKIRSDTNEMELAVNVSSSLKVSTSPQIILESGVEG